MNCFTHNRDAAVGICVACQKAVCHECVGRETPRLVCRACAEHGSVLGYEYRSSTTLPMTSEGAPLAHPTCLSSSASSSPEMPPLLL